MPVVIAGLDPAIHAVTVAGNQAEPIMSLVTTPYDTADYLDGPEAVAAYLEAVLEDRDPTLLARALAVVLRRNGMDARIKSGHDDNLKG